MERTLKMIGHPFDIDTATKVGGAVAAMGTAFWSVKKLWAYFWDVYVPRRVHGQESLRAVPLMQKTLEAVQVQLEKNAAVRETQNGELLAELRRTADLHARQNHETLVKLKEISVQVDGVIIRQDAADTRLNGSDLNYLETRKTVHYYGNLLMWLTHYTRESCVKQGISFSEPPLRDDMTLPDSLVPPTQFLPPGL